MGCGHSRVADAHDGSHNISKIENNDSNKTSDSDGPLGEFRRQAMVAYNKRAKRNNSTTIELDKDLNNKAQQWADHLAEKQLFETSKEIGVSQRLCGSGNLLTGEEVIEKMCKNNSEGDYTLGGFGRSTNRGLNNMYIYVGIFENVAPGADASQDDFRKQVLVAHNKKRALHSAQPLQLSNELNEIAQKWAEHLAATSSFQHSTKEFRNGAGENLATSSNKENGEGVSDMWYNEIHDYSWEQCKSKNGKAIGHFTQLVWTDCTHLGVGRSQKGPNGMYVYTANYRPAGNVIGHFKECVLPAKGKQ